MYAAKDKIEEFADASLEELLGIPMRQGPEEMEAELAEAEREGKKEQQYTLE